MPLEGKEALLDRFQGREVVGCQNFPLKDREVDLDLVEPAGVDGTMKGRCGDIFPQGVSRKRRRDARIRCP